MVLDIKDAEIIKPFTKASPLILDGMALLEAIGNTPLLPLLRVSRNISKGVKIFAKAEWFNPGGSIKDRPAFNIIRSAVFNGDLLPGMKLLDSTSGNMGIAYATFGAALDIPITLVVPENVSPERIAILHALGAELIFTNANKGTDGAQRLAQKMAKENPDQFFYANQYDNSANWKAHYYSTGPEIVHQTAGEITHFVAGLGTSGTLVGVAKFLREHNSEVEIVAVQPDLPSHKIDGLKHYATSIHPAIYDPAAPDEIIEVKTSQAYEMVACLAREEGYFVGISSGAAVAATLELASKLDQGVIVTIFPDAGYKYLSDNNLWKNNSCASP